MSDSKSFAIEDRPSVPAVDTVPHFIGGQVVEGNSGRHGDVYNPATGRLSRRVAFASKAEVDAAVTAAAGRVPAVGGDASAAAGSHPDAVSRAARA